MTDVAIAGPERSPGLANLAASLMLAVALPFVLGLWVNARRQVLAGLRDRAERLEREQVARSDQVRAQERARIAREMHDVVAHRVSLMVLHAGALEVSAPDERTAAEAALIRTTGREALGNLRDVLGVLRSPHTPAEAALHPQPVLDNLDHLLDQSRAVGIPVSRHDQGAATPLPVMVEQTAYRVVQEALTNVHKHAGQAATKVVLQYLPHSFEVTVHNDPAAPLPRTGQSLPGSGLGLIGLRERVELLGGEFETRPRTDGGFVVRARIPTGRTEEPA